MRKLVLVAALLATLMIAGQASAGKPSTLSRANAQALLKQTAAGSKSYVRCGFATNPHTGRYLKCLSYTHPASASRYYHETHVWQHTGAGLILTYQREGKTILVAKVRGISPESFLIESVICGEGTHHPC
jgi:hypothetical protein